MTKEIKIIGEIRVILIRIMVYAIRSFDEGAE